MVDWYLIKPQPTLNGGFEYNEFADYAQDGFDELLTETQLGKDIVFCKGQFDGEKFEVEVSSKGIVQSETPDAYTQGWKRQLLTRIGEIADYKYIKYDGFIWLIMTEPSDNCIYDKCVLHQCNYVLKWQTDKGKIVYYPANIENASQYNAGESGNKIVTLGYNQLMVYISMDETSLLINRNLRMFIDYNTVNPIPYKITRHDTVCYSYCRSRVINMVLTEDQYNPNTDNIDLMLCDYVPYTPYPITYSGKPIIRINGSKILKIDTVKNVEWSIKSDIGAKVTGEENVALIECPDNADYIGSIIYVTAKIGDETTVCELTITGGV